MSDNSCLWTQSSGRESARHEAHDGHAEPTFNIETVTHVTIGYLAGINSEYLRHYHQPTKIHGRNSLQFHVSMSERILLPTSQLHTFCQGFASRASITDRGERSTIKIIGDRELSILYQISLHRCGSVISDTL
ncbi:hypothetical protein F8M41_015311 [Gigaspora margarita]|uniref:Uncharacterized protein n=1 Tax=Gigaspora margarita TaxID=4874 RepID=A0A8H3WVR2_GIGMA|nr:hypothetical protein F8M41_015311 [Gigaspora margarita]